MTTVSLTFLEYRFKDDVVKKLSLKIEERIPPSSIPDDAIGYVYYDVLGFQLPDGSFETLGSPTNHSPMHFIGGLLDLGEVDVPRIKTRHGTVVPFEPCVLV